MDTINKLLSSLGIPGIYIGRRYLIEGIGIVLQDEDTIYQLNKSVYAPIAEKYQVDIRTIERNIRTVVNVFWEHGNRNRLDEIVGYHMLIKPKNGEFIIILVDFLKRKDNGL